MAAGEAWLFDNWRLHRVENPTADERIHLVADTSGSATFWQFVAGSDAGGLSGQASTASNGDASTAVSGRAAAGPGVEAATMSGGQPVNAQESASPRAQLSPFDPARDAQPLTERTVLAPVMAPAEVDLLVLDLQVGAGSAARARRCAGAAHALPRIAGFVLPRLAAALRALRCRARRLACVRKAARQCAPVLARVHRRARHAHESRRRALCAGGTSSARAVQTLGHGLLNALLDASSAPSSSSRPRARAARCCSKRSQ